MTKRLDKERQQELEPKRKQYAIDKLTELGIEIVVVYDDQISFMHKGCLCKLFPYSGWHTGKSIKDGRGINNLLEQLKSKQ